MMMPHTISSLTAYHEGLLEGAERERVAIVRWLRARAPYDESGAPSQPLERAADLIERGKHA
jgi:hypothetical protein